MPSITYEIPDGGTRDVDAISGSSVMETAVKNDVPGIVAECGGFLACATCHVYVDDAWLERVQAAGGPLEEMEDEMLDDAMSERLPGSRLSCQIVMSEDLDGLVVRIAPEQT